MAKKRILIVLSAVTLVSAFVFIGMLTRLRDSGEAGRAFPSNLKTNSDSPQTAVATKSGGNADPHTSVSPNMNVVEVLVELATGMDSPTGEELRVGADGSLVSAPTRRVSLLDKLIRLDLQAAAKQARTIMSDFNSSDEWAIALRASALADSSVEGRAYLEDRMQALLGHVPWQEKPSIGFLESFDVAVYLGGTNLLSPLTKLVRRTDNQAVAHAAFLALDRLSISDPLVTLRFLQTHPQEMIGREATRANLFSRADVSHIEQRAIIESYLLSEFGTPAELSTFAAQFPLANYMISHNLLTRSSTPDGATLARRDRAALAVVEEWIVDPKFQRIRGELETIRSRLGQFVVRPLSR